jgi:basic amino acid/polyamine antiporter, APA family
MEHNGPQKTLSVTDAVAIIVGVVVGVGIFKTPSIVAASSGSEGMVLLVWLLGGMISLVGALCYAELATTYPHAGGDYHYLNRAFGEAPAFMLAWARMTVIQTGSITMIAFLIGDYASEVLPLGSNSASYYAALIITFLTAVNVAGIQPGRWTQKALMVGILLGLLFVAVVGFAFNSHPPVSPQSEYASGGRALGRAMIFVLLTYGGWNEAAYLSSEVRDTSRNMVRVLLYSIAVITAIYLLTNIVFVKSLGLTVMSQSEVVAADLMRRALGEHGARFISLLIILAALSTMNAVIITGARTTYALGQNYSFLSFLGRWQERGNTPANALLLQGAVSLLLVLVGTGTRSGFVMMVEYTAPVFWFFLLLVGISIFVLRHIDAGSPRPFRTPFYPFTPLLFCIACIYMLQSSLAYTGTGALLGVGVLLAGIPLLLLQNVGKDNLMRRGTNEKKTS